MGRSAFKGTNSHACSSSLATIGGGLRNLFLQHIESKLTYDIDLIFVSCEVIFFHTTMSIGL